MNQCLIKLPVAFTTTEGQIEIGAHVSITFSPEQSRCTNISVWVMDWFLVTLRGWRGLYQLFHVDRAGWQSAWYRQTSTWFPIAQTSCRKDYSPGSTAPVWHISLPSKKSTTLCQGDTIQTNKTFRGPYMKAPVWLRARLHACAYPNGLLCTCTIHTSNYKDAGRSDRLCFRIFSQIRKTSLSVNPNTE